MAEKLMDKKEMTEKVEKKKEGLFNKVKKLKEKVVPAENEKQSDDEEVKPKKKRLGLTILGGTAAVAAVGALGYLLGRKGSEEDEVCYYEDVQDEPCEDECSNL